MMPIHVSKAPRVCSFCHVTEGFLYCVLKSMGIQPECLQWTYYNVSLQTSKHAQNFQSCILIHHKLLCCHMGGNVIGERSDPSYSSECFCIIYTIKQFMGTAIYTSIYFRLKHSTNRTACCTRQHSSSMYVCSACLTHWKTLGYLYLKVIRDIPDCVLF